MSRSKENQHNTLPAPALIAPREAAVLDGRRVTFEWEPVEEATRYQLEIARDPEFEDMVLERVVGLETQIALEDAFEIDGTTYFWRVLSGNDAGWSNGEHIESFVSVSAEDAVAKVSRPDERLGPYPALIRSASVEAAAEVTGEEELYADEAREGVQHEGVEAGQILGIALAIMASVVMIVIVLFQWTEIVASETRTAAAGMSGYPELRRVEMRAQQQLREYAILDQDAGVYRIPIERAMDLLVEEAADTQRTPAGPFPAR